MIERFIKFQNNAREKLLEDISLKIKGYFYYTCSGAIFFCYAYFKNSFNLDSWFFNILYYLLVITNISTFVIIDFNGMNNNIKHFLFFSAIASISIGFSSYMILFEIISKSYFPYVVMVITMTIIWTFLSGICDLKIAIISNSIYAVILAIILQASSFIWKIFQVNNINLGLSKFAQDLNISQYEFMELAINILIFPMFIMVTIGALFCAYKEYFYKEDLENHCEEKQRN